MNIKIIQKLLTIVVIIVLTAVGISYKKNIDKNSSRYYEQGLNFYNQGNFSDAYYNFKQIKPFSNMHELALLKQYQCANNLNDKKTSLAKLKEIIKFSKNDYIKPWALYQETILMQELKSTSDAILSKKFKYIHTNYPNSDFGIASAYKTAQLSKNINVYNAKQNYINYLSYAPMGKFSISAIEELSKLNLELSKEDNEIIADALLENERYQKAIEYYKKTIFSKNWYKISKCYQYLKDNEQEKQAILKGFDLAISDVSEKEIGSAIDRYILLSNANKMQLLQELYTKYQDSYIFPTVVYKLAETSNSIRSIKLYELIVNEYPVSVWASNSLWEIFWYNYQQNRFETCEKLAKQHMSQYSGLQDSPRIAYWYARALLKSRKNTQAKEVLYDVIENYPLSYYAFLSAKQLKKSKAKKMIVKKPIAEYNKNNLDRIIFKDKTLLKIAQINDWELIDALKIDDEYIKSWIAYKKENTALAINIAKNELLEENKKINPTSDKENENIKFSNQLLKLIYPIFYEKEINQYAHNLKHSPYLFLSLVREESHFNKSAKSAVGATGLAQLMPETANFIEKTQVPRENLLNPEENIRIGMNYFDYLIKLFNGNEYLAILAYNAGPGNVKKWLNDSKIESSEIEIFVENIPFLETKNYIKKILSSYWIYLNIYSAKNK